MDRGASYIHGCNRDDNWVLNLAKEMNVSLAREYGGYQAGWLNSCLWFGQNGGRVSRGEVNKAWTLFQDVAEALSDKATELNAKEVDMSVRHYLENCLPKHLGKQLKELSEPSRMVFSRMVDTVWGYVGSVDQLSARLMARVFHPGIEEPDAQEDDTPIESPPVAVAEAAKEPEASLPEEDEDALVVSGYDFLIDKLSHNVDVRLSKVVCAVVSRKDNVTVFTRDGDSYVCDAVIIAVPLGVLQCKSPETSIRFIPPLSDGKVVAINRMAMGAENKVIMQFRKPFWPLSQTPYMQTVVNGLRFLSLHHYDKPGVLVAHLCPPLSIELEQSSDEAILAKVLDVLRTQFGPEMVTSADLLHYDITRWTIDPFCCGSYSFMPVGASFDDVHAIKAPEQCLLFAGEHTSAYDGQCVTGAFDTGHDAAMDTVQIVLQMQKCDFCQCWYNERGPPKENANEESRCSACEKKDPEKERFCICRKKDDGREYVQCLPCSNWFHLDCMNLKEAPIDDFTCPGCVKRAKKRVA